MKKSLLILSFIFVALSAFAQLKDGYYRVTNVGDGRYIYLTDNTGSVSVGTLSADMKAVHLIKGQDKTISNPQTVLYISHVSGNQYNIAAQGTSVKDIIGYAVNVRYEERAQAYRVYAEAHGATLYLGSNANNYYKTEEISYLSTGESGNQTLWKLEPIDSEGDNYFGITPSIEADGKYYQSFYASFPFSFKSKGMKAYYVKDDNGEPKLVEIKDKVIAAKTPVIIECSSKNPSDNRLEILTTGGNAISDNMLRGVMFCNTARVKSKDAVTKNDKETMRVLGVENGKLTFTVSQDENLPANQAYLLVSAGNDIPFVFEDDQESKEASLETIKGVYSILGIKVRDDDDISDLAAGIYIVNGKKIIKR